LALERRESEPCPVAALGRGHGPQLHPTHGLEISCSQHPSRDCSKSRKVMGERKASH